MDEIEINDEEREQKILHFNSCWTDILDHTLKPFIKRVETNSDESLRNLSIPYTQYHHSYQIIFGLCTQKDPFNYSKMLYQEHSEFLKRYCLEVLMPKLIHGKKENNFFEIWVWCWRKYKWIVDGLKRIFMYLNKFYVKSNNLQPLNLKGYSIYKKFVFLKFDDFVKSNAIDLFTKNRQNTNKENRITIKQSLLVFSQLGELLNENYYNPFEEKVVILGKKYYKDFSKKLVSENINFIKFIDKALKLISDEKIFCEQMFLESTRERLCAIFVDHLMDVHYKNYIKNNEKNLRLMLKNSQFEDLSKTYSLYKLQSSKVGLVSLNDSLASYLSIELKQIGKKWKTAKREELMKVVLKAAKLTQKTLDMVNLVFYNDNSFKNSIKNVVSNFLSNQDCAALDIARLINSMMCKKLNGYKENKFYNVLGKRMIKFSQLMVLCKYFPTPEKFERAFTMYLAERLIHSNSKSLQMERDILSKLGDVMKCKWIERYNLLSSELEKSKLLLKDWGSKHPKCVINPVICSKKTIPLIDNTDFVLNKDLQNEITLFSKFYDTKNYNRTLNWRIDQGRADLSIRLNSRKICKMNVTTLQMLILLLFNGSRNTLTFKEIINTLKVPKTLLKFHLSFLISSKSPVLSQYKCDSTKCSYVNENVYMLNENLEFESLYIPPFYNERYDMLKLNIEKNIESQSDENALSDFGSFKKNKKKKTDTIISETKRQFDEEWLEGTIMRLLKRNKKMKKEILIDKVFNLQGTVSEDKILQKIDFLMSRGFLKFVEKDNFVKYIP